MMKIAGRNESGVAKPISLNANDEVKTTQVLQMTKVIESEELVPNGEYVTRRLPAYKYTKGTLNLRMSNTRAIEVYVQYSGTSGVPTGPKSLVYRSDGTQNIHHITFPLLETLYELTIKNIATDGNVGTGPTSILTLSHDDDVLGGIRNLKDETLENLKLFKQDVMENLADDITENLADDINKKKPLNTISWQKTPVNWRDFTVGYDNRHYLITVDYTVKVYDNIIGGEEVDSGVTLTGELQGVRQFYVMPEGLTYFVSTDDNEVAIYHAKDIHTQPTVVYRSTTQTNSVFSRNFGIDGFTDGINSILFAGAYGTGQDNKPLVLSTDGGKTFELVKETQNIDTSGSFNSHWHDVAIDPYHGYLWASEGDGSINQAIWYSDNLGKTWNKIESDAQPTTLDVFPDRVNLGRDSHLVGTDVIKKHNLVTEKMFVESVREFKNQTAFNYYANKAVVKENEGYMNFSLYDGSDRPMIVGTGDGGISWHGLGFGVNDVDHFFDIDDTYVYARGKDGRIYYFERIKWG